MRRRRTPRRRRGRSGCRARTPSSGRSASRAGGRRGPAGAGGASRRRPRAAAASRARTGSRDVAADVHRAAGRQRRDHSGVVVGLSRRRRRGRVVVVSPHLDDGVLSLGASIARWSGARGGRRAPHRARLRSGLGRARRGLGRGAAALRPRASPLAHAATRMARRARSSARCRAGCRTGASTTSVTATTRTCAERWRARSRAPTRVLVPGFPLSHPDHEWLMRTLAAGRLDARRVGFYAEQPYTRRARRRAAGAGLGGRGVRGTVVVRRRPVGARDRLAKWRAIRRYRSQLPLLGMRGSMRAALTGKRSRQR